MKHICVNTGAAAGKLLVYVTMILYFCMTDDFVFCPAT